MRKLKDYVEEQRSANLEYSGEALVNKLLATATFSRLEYIYILVMAGLISYLLGQSIYSEILTGSIAKISLAVVLSSGFYYLTMFFAAGALIDFIGELAKKITRKENAIMLGKKVMLILFLVFGLLIVLGTIFEVIK